MNYNYQNQYGYNTYPYNQQQFQQINNGYNQQQMNQNLSNYNSYQPNYNNPSQQMRVKCDYLNVSNLDEVKAYIVNPNQVIIFNDENNKIIYKKITDSQGISKIFAYQEINLEQPKQNNNIEYLSLNDFNAFKKEIEQKINDCVQKTQNMNPMGEN